MSRDNRTPLFENQGNVRFAEAPENVPGSENEPADIPDQEFGLLNNNNERVDTCSVNIGLMKLIPKTEILLGYDYAKSDQSFIHAGPRVDALAALVSPLGAIYGNQFQPLPDVGNTLKGATVDLKYFLSPTFAIGANFIHQTFDVADRQTTGLNGYATCDPIGGLALGYGFRPYTANVGGIRVIYLF